MSKIVFESFNEGEINRLYELFLNVCKDGVFEKKFIEYDKVYRLILDGELITEGNEQKTSKLISTELDTMICDLIHFYKLGRLTGKFIAEKRANKRKYEGKELSHNIASEIEKANLKTFEKEADIK